VIKFNVFDVDLSFYPNDLNIFIPIVAGLIGFILFWFSQKSIKLKNRLQKRYGTEKGQANLILFSRYFGGFSIGFFPFLVFLILIPEYDLFRLGFAYYRETALVTFACIVGISLVIIPLVSFSARKPESLLNYPQIRTKVWSKKLFGANLLSWAVYLLGYEFFFRGVLLFPLASEIGVWPAIAVNIGLYSATHIPKGLSETIGAIPLSVILCILSLQTGTIWIAFFVHLVMAWTNAIVAFKNNKQMSFLSN